MLALATQVDERLLVSSIELDVPERPYTIETLARLRETVGPQVRLFFMMGPIHGPTLRPGVNGRSCFS
jgi:nicotinic acid mononucleotide adenylyltransferase